MKAMSQINFKLYSEIIDESTSEERLNEIFGLFKNNAKVEKLRKEREALLAAKKKAVADKDAAWKAAKDRADAENRSEMYWKNKTARAKQADARAGELDWVKEEALQEAMTIRHDHKSLVTSLEHFGSTEENPDGRRDLNQALKIMGKKVPEDKVWAYNTDEHQEQFERISRKLKVQNPDEPDLNDLLRAKFERVKKMNGTTFLKRGNVVALLSDSHPTTYLVSAKELESAE